MKERKMKRHTDSSKIEIFSPLKMKTKNYNQRIEMKSSYVPKNVIIYNLHAFKEMLTVAGETRVACVIFGVQSDSDVVGVVGVFCWL